MNRLIASLLLCALLLPGRAAQGGLVPDAGVDRGGGKKRQSEYAKSHKLFHGVSPLSCLITNASFGTPPHPPQCAHWGTFPSRGRL